MTGAQGALIAAPYSDINLAVTNGMLTVTNLLESDIPNWSGSVQAWSTRWTNVDAVTGISFDYRVLVVASQLSSTTVPWVQNLKLYTGNSLVISDVLNVFGSLYIGAKNLTVTLNGVGNGATSIEGQLNSYIPGNIGPSQMPNLVDLTNNGSITSQGLLVLTNVNNYGAVINSGVISDNGTLIYATNFVSSGAISNGIGNMTVLSKTTTLTNGFINAGGNVSITANSLTASNVLLQCLSLTLNPANYLSDGVLGDSGVTNANFWVVGRTNATGGSGFTLLDNPTNGDLLGTAITNICPGANKSVVDTWAGQDFGAVNTGLYQQCRLGPPGIGCSGPQQPDYV